MNFDAFSQHLYRRTLDLSTFADFAEYTSLLGGIYAVTRDQPDLFFASLCGGGYVLSKALSRHWSLLCDQCTRINHAEQHEQNMRAIRSVKQDLERLASEKETEKEALP